MKTATAPSARAPRPRSEAAAPEAGRGFAEPGVGSGGIGSAQRGAAARALDGPPEALDRRPDHPLELGQPLLERRLRLDPDLELAVRQDTHAAGVHGPEREDAGLAGDAGPTENLDEGLDLLGGDGVDRHAVHPPAAA